MCTLQANPTAPQVCKTIAPLRQLIANWRDEKKTIGFVPTMGALHAGHLSLVRACRQQCDVVIVSIFVNPTQFAPEEDLEQYPRDLETDVALLAEEQVDVVFAPSTEEMYRDQHQSFVEVGSVSESLEGECRPHHFRGVATIVLKLLNITTPDVVFFGQKDYQQTVVIRQMVQDLNLSVELAICPIVREADGLAMSSRNAYLSETERQQALSLSRGLRAGKERIVGGEKDAAAIREIVRKTLEESPDLKVEYVAVIAAGEMRSVSEIEGPVVIALAAQIGNTRLIDNCLVE